MLGDVPNAPAPATAPEQDYPIELLCPICFNLLDDPVTWPAPQCEEKHNFCRHCIETMCETREVKSLCPICRAPSTVPVLDQLWTLPVDEILNERLKTEYPEHHAESMARRERKHAEYDALPRIRVPVFESCEHQLAEPSRERLHRGKKVDFRISKPEHLLLLATCFANPETTRFGILLEGERWGYIAGSACLSRLTPLPSLRFRPPTSGIDDAKDTTKSIAHPPRPAAPCSSERLHMSPPQQRLWQCARKCLCSREVSALLRQCFLQSSHRNFSARASGQRQPIRHLPSSSLRIMRSRRFSR